MHATKRARRLGWQFVTALAIAALATACSFGGGSAPGGKAASGGGVTISVWSPENRPEDAAAHQWLIQRFEAANPGVKVQVTTTSWDDHFAKIDAAKGARNLPDIVYTWQPNTTALIQKRLLADITDVWNAVGADNFPAGERERLSVSGKYYAIPIFGYPHGIWYRTDWLQEAGAQPPTSWDGFVQAAKAMTRGGRYGLCLFNKGLNAYYITDMMLADGAEPFDKSGKITINSPATVKVLTLLKTFSEAHVSPAGWTSMNMDDAKLPFIAGKCGMKLDSTSFLNALSKDNPELLAKVGVVPIPLNGGRYAGWAPTSQYAVTAGAKHPAEAKKFLEFMFQPDSYTGFMSREVLGFLPVFKPVASSDQFYGEERIKPVAAIYKNMATAAANGAPTEGSQYPEVSQENSIVYNQQVYAAMGDMIANGKSPAEVASWAASRIGELTK